MKNLTYTAALAVSMGVTAAAASVAIPTDGYNTDKELAFYMYCARSNYVEPDAIRCVQL